MKHSKFKWMVLVVVVGTASCAFAAPRDEVTLVLVPRNETTVKLGTDIAERFPTLLLSYQLAPDGTASLQGWTGSQWVGVTIDNFQAGDFFRTGPATGIIVEEEGKPVPENIIPSPEWCPNVYKLGTTETRPLLHLIGRHFDFPYKAWQWFAKRYNMDMDAINPDGLNVAWYHKSLAGHLKENPYSYSNDIQYWLVVHEPVEVAEPMDVAAMDAVDGSETNVAAVEENPLSEEAPAAIVLTAGDAEETVAAETEEVVEGLETNAAPAKAENAAGEQAEEALEEPDASEAVPMEMDE